MRVNIADLKAEAGLHKRVPLEITPEPIEMGGDRIEFSGPFTGEAEIWNTGDRLFVEAKVSGEATVACSRCLTPVRLPLDVDFDEEFIEGTPAAPVAEEEESPEERAVSYFEGDEIDLTDPLRENIVLALPMKPLCKDDCAGLCPSCGKNLNEGPCDCAGDADVDPRLSVLQNLLRKPDSNS